MCRDFHLILNFELESHSANVQGLMPAGGCGTTGRISYRVALFWSPVTTGPPMEPITRSPPRRGSTHDLNLYYNFPSSFSGSCAFCGARSTQYRTIPTLIYYQSWCESAFPLRLHGILSFPALPQYGRFFWPDCNHAHPLSITVVELRLFPPHFGSHALPSVTSKSIYQPWSRVRWAAGFHIALASYLLNSLLIVCESMNAAPLFLFLRCFYID